jgi:hypothetical protein
MQGKIGNWFRKWIKMLLNRRGDLCGAQPSSRLARYSRGAESPGVNPINVGSFYTGPGRFDVNVSRNYTCFRRPALSNKLSH